VTEAVTTADRRGRFVALVGPDGTGKTTVAEWLANAWPGPTSYVHFRPPLRAPLPRRPSEVGSVDVPKHTHAGPRTLGWLRLLRSVLLFWLGYRRRVRPALASGALVVADRWGYGYVAQPVALRFAGPPWLGRLAVRLLPRPDLVVNLAAPVATIRARKGELTDREICDELQRWHQLPVANLVTVDARKPPADLVAEILLLLDRPGAR
jgi:thymidylate kinase